MSKLTGAEIVIECLKEQGVDTVFGYKPKASAYVFMDAARSCTGMDVSLISGCSLMPSSSE